MSQVVVIGCGVVGAAIAYELSQVPSLTVTVVDRQPPAQGATGAALGVLMGVISHKVKGKAWRMRQTSLQQYERWVPELEAVTGRSLPFNRQGILKLCFEGEDLSRWEKLAEVRRSQGWSLEVWDRDTLQARCPYLGDRLIQGAVYSPQDRQLDPTALTLALVEASRQRGVRFYFGVEVQGIEGKPGAAGLCLQVAPNAEMQEALTTDWVVISAGLGSMGLTGAIAQPVEIRPVLGQALHLRLRQPLGDLGFQPVITGDDSHLVPLGGGEYWLGATVEFMPEQGELVADGERLREVLEGAIAFCPDLARAEVLRSWSGMRPRPEGRPAPIVERLAGCENVLLATGHYRNGVLLAPATALMIRELIVEK